MTGQDWMEKDFYAALGVPKDASAADVKKAYRKLARTLHPDANPGDADERRFKDLGEAYAVLSDPEKRQQYDAIRAMAGGARFSAGGPGGAAGSAGFEDLLGGMFGGGAPGGTRVRFGRAGGGAGGGPGGAAGGGVPPGFEDLLGGMFGSGGGGYDTYAPAGPRRGVDVEASTSLAFVQAVQGSTVTLQGADGRRVTARIPPGVRDGQRIRLRGKGRPGDDGAPAGDLILTVAVEPHPVFTRRGDDLRVTLPVTFPEATLGAQVQVPTLDGSLVRLNIPAGTPSGRTLRLRGRGVATAKHTGDLLVTIQVVVPQRLDDDARAAVEAFAAAAGAGDVRGDVVARARDAAALR